MEPFSQNARVCFLGDSITHNNEFVSRICAYYHDFISERQVKFYNCGISGGSIYALFANFDDDVIAHKPTHAVVMIGINASRRIEKAKQYVENGEDGPHRDYFVRLSKEYITNKPIQQQLEDEANALMDELYSK